MESLASALERRESIVEGRRHDAAHYLADPSLLVSRRPVHSRYRDVK